LILMRTGETGYEDIPTYVTSKAFISPIFHHLFHSRRRLTLMDCDAAVTPACERALETYRGSFTLQSESEYEYEYEFRPHKKFLTALSSNARVHLDVLKVPLREVESAMSVS